MTQIFRRALGGHERIVVGDEDRRGSPVAPAVADDDHVRPGGLAVVTAIVAGGLALVAITLVFVLATARQVVTEGSDDDGDRFGEAIQLAPQGIDVIERSMPSPAEAPPSPQHESPPSSAPGKAATRPAVPAGSGNRSPSAAGRVSLTEWAVISLVGAAVAALSGLGRRRRRWFV